MRRAFCFMSLPAFPVYLFDVDGTLLDSQLDICGSVQQVLTNRGRADIEHQKLVGYIGWHLRDQFLDLGYPEQAIEGMIAEYRYIYPARKHSSTQAYTGVAETLEQLGGRKSTATTKGTPMARSILEQFGLLRHFDHVQGTDGFAAKPAPDVLIKSVEVFGVRREECLFVGDSAADMEAGKRAGIRTCAVTWGYGSREDLARWQPDFWIDSPAELIAPG